ncbi:hypothetical protein R3I94_008769 [Phoxinus phoxinus]
MSSFGVCEAQVLPFVLRTIVLVPCTISLSFFRVPTNLSPPG